MPTDAYRAGYEQALKTIQERLPSAKIILALSTPLQSTSAKNHLNTMVDTRNEIVQELSDRYNLKVNDLHSISKDHPEYYRDPYHYKPEAIRRQGDRVARMIRPLLP